MKNNEQKLVLHFLKAHLSTLEKDKNQEVNPLFRNFFTRAELIDMLECSTFDKDLNDYYIDTLENSDLLELISSDYFILNYYIEKFEINLQARNDISQSDVHQFFERINEEGHYLFSKPIEDWDDYDLSNYYSKTIKYSTTKKVFAIYLSDVEEKDKYLVTTKPSYFFETQEMAEVELENIIKEKGFSRDELKIMSLWQIVNK